MRKYQLYKKRGQTIAVLLLQVVCITILLSSVTFAFDGNHKGFVLGGGLGIFSLPSGSDSSKITMHFAIGVGISKKDIVVMEFAGAGSQKVTDFSGKNKQSISGKSFSFVSWYHYFNTSQSSWFAGIGLGKYNPTWMVESIVTPPMSIMTSAGYEHRHMTAKLYMILIRIDGIRSQKNYQKIHLGLMFGLLAF